MEKIARVIWEMDGDYYRQMILDTAMEFPYNVIFGTEQEMRDYIAMIVGM